jgi:hypothetical protein
VIDTYQPGPATTRATLDLVQAVPTLRPFLDERSAQPDDVPASVIWADFRGGREHAALGALTKAIRAAGGK